MAEAPVKVIAENRKARHDYFIEETLEAGIALTGTEVKSLRAGRANLKDSYAQVIDGEMMLISMHISPYEQGNRYNVDPLRNRKLLLHRNEINRLYGKVKQQGLALIPLKLYFKKGRVKVELALGRGKKLYDKRDAMAEKDARRDVERTLRGKDKYE
jgi:SsrA-binding protein